MRATKISLPLMAALLVGICLPQNAKADAFSFSYSSGYNGYNSYNGYNRHDHDDWHRHSDWRRGRYYNPGYAPYPGYRSYIVTPPPVVYAPPPQTTVVVPAAPPTIIFDDPSMVASQVSPTYTNDEGQLCREYQATAHIGRKTKPIYGTACLQPDGTWRVVD